MEAELFVLLVVIYVTLSLAWMIHSHLERKKYKQEMGATQRTDHSLGTKELKTLIREAMSEANVQLVDRIEMLEEEVRQAKAPRLTPAQLDPMLEDFRQTHPEALEPVERRSVT